MYVEEQVGYGGCEIGGCEEKSGIFFLFGKITKQETSTDRGINTKKNIIEYFFEFKEKTGFEFPPPPLSVVLTPHCVHHIKITQERYKIIKVIGKMY